jgi:hypothetical protein
MSKTLFSLKEVQLLQKSLNVQKKKQNLVNRCYDAGGTPVIEAGDTGSIHDGTPRKAWREISNTYTFECVK